MNTSSPSRSQCLACAVLDDCNTWLGDPSPRHIDAFLNGAQVRASLTEPTLHTWKIFGPLREQAFSDSLVARTGRPTLSIRWPSALEMLHFQVGGAVAELKTLVTDWFDAGRLDVEQRVEAFDASAADPCEAFLTSFLQRPAMYLGSLSGWQLYCFLLGITRGGDWLALPPLRRLSEVFDDLARQSREAYGSDFAAYRVYDAPGLIEWLSR